MARFMASVRSKHSRHASSPAAAVTIDTSPDISDSNTSSPSTTRSSTISSACTTSPSSPDSFDTTHHRTFSLTSLKSRSWRSNSNKEANGGGIERTHSFRARARRISWSRPASSASHVDVLSLRSINSEALERGHARSLSGCSTPDTASLLIPNPSSSSPSSSIDWSAQQILGHGSLEPDPGLLKPKAPHLVITPNYLVKLRSFTDAQVLFPDLPHQPADEGTSSKRHTRSSSTSTSTAPSQPLLVIPTDAIVSAFPSETGSSGIEVWWRNPLSSSSSTTGIGTDITTSKNTAAAANPAQNALPCRVDLLSLPTPTQRDEMLHHIACAILSSNRHHQQDATTEGPHGGSAVGSSGSSSPLRNWQDLRPLLESVVGQHDDRHHHHYHHGRRSSDMAGLEQQQLKLHHRKPDIFPVVPRGAVRREWMPKLKMKLEEKKTQEAPAWFLVVADTAGFCYLVQVDRVGASVGGNCGLAEGEKKGKGWRSWRYGLVTLEEMRGEWLWEEERFVVTFREPFSPPVVLELASRYYRQIIRAVGMADRYLKPAWPQMWQTREIFHVAGLQEAQYLVAKEDFGSFQRTLHAYLAAYGCEPVRWEINWRTPYAPEFRLLPAKKGSAYTPRQLLAVFRALRYNDYFTSLSFQGVDLSVLWGLKDTAENNAAYLSRSCFALERDEIKLLRQSPLLYQEFHALAFCSETVRQIDLGNCTSSLSSKLATDKNAVTDLQFLAPILSLLRGGITKCNRLIISGNILPLGDIQDLALTMKCGVIQALDVSCCGLDDYNLYDMIVEPLPEQRGQLQSLAISGNPGRLSATVLPDLLGYLADIRELRLAGSIQGDSSIEVSVLPFDVLQYMNKLEVLDLSGYKLNDATFSDLERFLEYRSWQFQHSQPPKLHTLVLNHCGITGTLAARLFTAIGINNGLVLSLTSNPIEQGISSLASAILAQAGPAALYLDMIEFRHEPNYLSLIHALTTTKHLRLLSLVGTAPSPSPTGRCSDDLVSALHTFLAKNESIRYLDLSGFSSKLEDVQLPAGFGRALAGLADNETLTHLRIRNQNLHHHVEAGVLGRALKANRTLRAVDCRENNLTLTSVRFLVDSLAEAAAAGQGRIVSFPLARRREREAIWENVLRGVKRGSGSGSGLVLDSAAPAVACPKSGNSGGIIPRSSSYPSPLAALSASRAESKKKHARSMSLPVPVSEKKKEGEDNEQEEEIRLLRQTLDEALAKLRSVLRANRQRLHEQQALLENDDDMVARATSRGRGRVRSSRGSFAASSSGLASLAGSLGYRHENDELKVGGGAGHYHHDDDYEEEEADEEEEEEGDELASCWPSKGEVAALGRGWGEVVAGWA